MNDAQIATLGDFQERLEAEQHKATQLQRIKVTSVVLDSKGNILYSHDELAWVASSDHYLAKAFVHLKPVTPEELIAAESERGLVLQREGT